MNFAEHIRALAEVAVDGVASAHAALSPTDKLLILGAIAAVAVAALLAIFFGREAARRGGRALTLRAPNAASRRALLMPADRSGAGASLAPAHAKASGSPVVRGSAGLPARNSTLPKSASTPRVHLLMRPLFPLSASKVERELGQQLMLRLEAVLGRLTPQLAAGNGSGRVGRRPRRFEIGGTVLHMGDRIRVYVEMIDSKTGAPMFRLRYQCLPTEQDLILAEIAKRIMTVAYIRGDTDISPFETIRSLSSRVAK